MPTAMRPSGTVKSGSSAPGSEQPENATPKRAGALVGRGRRRARPRRATSPSSAAAAGDLEDGEVAGDAAALVRLVDRGARDVVGHGDGAGRRCPRRAASCCGRVEVEHVARVVAVAEQHAAAVLGRLRDRRDLLRGRRGEEVAHRGAVREALADESAERRVVAGAAADDERDGASGVGASSGRRRRAPGAPSGRLAATKPSIISSAKSAGSLKRRVMRPSLLCEEARSARRWWTSRACAAPRRRRRRPPVRCASCIRPSTNISTAESSMKKPTMNIGTW